MAPYGKHCANSEAMHTDLIVHYAENSIFFSHEKSILKSYRVDSLYLK